MAIEDRWQATVTQISGGATLFVIARLFSKFVGFAFTLIITRQIGAAGYGLYSYAISLIAMLILLAPVGSDKSLLRFLPEFRDDRRRADTIVSLSFVTAIVGGVLFGSVLLLAAPLISEFTLDEPQFVTFLQLIAILVPIRSLIITTTNTFRALKLIRIQLAVKQIAEPFLKLLVTLFAFWLGYSLYGVVIGVVIGGSLTLAIGIVAILRYTDISLSLAITVEEFKSYYNFSLPIAVKNMGGILYSKTDIIMLGLFVSSASVGVYNIAVLLATLIALPLTGFNQLFPSFASELYNADEQDELSAIHLTLVRWTFTITLFGIGFLAVYRTKVLGVFGEDFQLAELSLLLLLGGQMGNSLGYGSGYFLTVSDHQYVLLINQWTFGLLNVGLNYLGIVTFGIHGAALATASVMALQNFTRIVESWYLEDYYPYDLSVLRPVFPAIIGILVMILVKGLLDGYISVVVGAALGFLSYAILLYHFGLEQEDIALLQELHTSVDQE